MVIMNALLMYSLEDVTTWSCSYDHCETDFGEADRHNNRGGFSLVRTIYFQGALRAMHHMTKTTIEILSTVKNVLVQ